MLGRHHSVVGNVVKLSQGRIHRSIQNHIRYHCGQLKLIGQTLVSVASFIPTLNPEDPN